MNNDKRRKDALFIIFYCVLAYILIYFTANLMN